jgi:ferric-dicitrate binding protein FerR (iron transport regulator)
VSARSRRLALIVTLILSLRAALPASGQNAPVGTAVNAVGTLLVTRTDGIEDRLQGKGQLPVFEHDLLRTEAGVLALVELADGIQLAVNENTTFTVLSRWEKRKGVTRIVRLKEGEIWVKTSGGPKQFEVETPVATAAVKETEFNLKVDADGQSTLTVIEGLVEFGTPFGTCPIPTKTVSYGVRGKRCTRPTPTDVAPAVEWGRALQR